MINFPANDPQQAPVIKAGVDVQKPLDIFCPHDREYPYEPHVLNFICLLFGMIIRLPL